MTPVDQARTSLALVLFGSGALIWLWLLWHVAIRDRADAAHGDKGTAGADDGAGHSNPDTQPVKIRVLEGDCIELDGYESNLPAVITWVRSVGVARVYVTGNAREGWVTSVLSTLRAIPNTRILVHDPAGGIEVSDTTDLPVPDLPTR